MNFINNVVSITFLFMYGFLSVQAQNNLSAYAGSKGIYVFTPPPILSRSHPFQEAVKYRIERKENGEKKYQKIIEMDAPVDLASFTARLNSSFSICPFPIYQKAYEPEKIWNEIQKNPEQSKGWYASIPVASAMGLMYLDSTVRSGKSYIYKIISEDVSGKAQSEIETGIISFPGKATFPNNYFLESDNSGPGCKTSWITNSKNTASNFRLHRQDSVNGLFHDVNASIGRNSKQDTLFISAMDYSVEKEKLVVYKLVSADAWGNIGSTSAAYPVGTYELNNSKLPIDLTAISADSLGGILLSWTLPEKYPVKSIRLYRAEKSDGPYSLLMEFQNSAKRFLDNSVEPVKDYYYRLTVTGFATEDSKTTMPSRGVYFSGLKPASPSITSSKGTERGVKLTIAANNKDISGFRVYRNTSSNAEMQLISSFIRNDALIVTFIDSSDILSGKIVYGYAAVSVNESNMESSLSDTIWVHPLIKTILPVPLDVAILRIENSKTVFWRNMRDFDETVAGYELYYRNAGSTESWKMLGEMIPASRNRYSDSTDINSEFEYGLKTVDVFGNRSDMSEIVSLKINNATELPAPQGLIAYSSGDGIMLVWMPMNLRKDVKYKLYRYERRAKPVLLSTIPSDAETVYSDMKAEKGKLYFYYLTLTDSLKNESARGNEVNARK